MKTVVEINEELQFNTELMSLLEVMKNISIFRFRALQAKKRRFEVFTQVLGGFFEMLDLGNVIHPYIIPSEEKAAFILITSDAGFMGGLNLAVIDAALKTPEAVRAEIIVVGERGAFHLGEIGRKFTAFKSATSPEERYKLALELKDYVLKGVKEKRLGKVFLFYPRPISFIVQKVEGMRLLPITETFGTLFTPGKFVIPRMTGPEIIVESPKEGIMEFLVEEQILQKLIDVLEDSKLSEYASRAIHLEESNRDLEEKQKGLKFQYFRAYHEVIDKNIRELFSAQVISRR